jgi:hypothetical protein
MRMHIKSVFRVHAHVLKGVSRGVRMRMQTLSDYGICRVIIVITVVCPAIVSQWHDIGGNIFRLMLSNDC